MDDITQIREGHAAAALLANPDLLAIFAAVRSDAYKAIELSLPTEQEKRENQYQLLRGLAAIEHEIQVRVTIAAQLEAMNDAEVAGHDYYR